MNKKAKGSNAERELISLFWKNGFAALRSAGSGSMRYPSPDIIVSNRIKTFAIECKSTKDLKKYLSEDDVNQLKTFCEIYGAEPWLGIRFDVLKWFFLTIEDLEKTSQGYKIDIEIAQRKGLLFEELIHDSIV